MRILLMSTLLVAIILMPLSASAAGISFGGRVVSELPCISPLGPSLVVTIRPAGIFPITYIWTPATITKPTQASIPIIGGQVLGIADIPYACWNPVKGGLFGLFTFFSYSYGLRMQIVGTSLPGLSSIIPGGGSFGGGGSSASF